MSAKRATPLAADEKVDDGYRWPALLLVVSWPWRKLAAIAGGDIDDPRTVVAIMLTVVLSIAAGSVWLAFLATWTGEHRWIALAMWAFMVYGMFHVFRWLFRRKQEDES